jgi:hypothetical protein
MYLRGGLKIINGAPVSQIPAQVSLQPALAGVLPSGLKILIILIKNDLNLNIIVSIVLK